MAYLLLLRSPSPCLSSSRKKGWACRSGLDSLRPAGLPLPIEKSLLRRLNQSVLGNAAFLAEAVADRNELSINLMSARLQIEDAGAQAINAKFAPGFHRGDWPALQAGKEAVALAHGVIREWPATVRQSPSAGERCSSSKSIGTCPTSCARANTERLA